jgi:hypothetical protein
VRIQSSAVSPDQEPELATFLQKIIDAEQHVAAVVQVGPMHRAELRVEGERSFARRRNFEDRHIRTAR